MIIKQLKDNEPLKVEEVIAHREIPAFRTFLIEKKVQTRVFTDGQIIGEDGQRYETIREYYIDDKKYKSKVDGKIIKNIHIKNHSYAISCIVVDNNGFLQIKDITIYLKDPKDIKALKEAKWVIRNTIHHFNWSELHKNRFSLEDGLERYSGEEVSENVYCLNKTNVKRCKYFK